MKASELIKFALVNGFYVQPVKAKDLKSSSYMCHALEYCQEKAGAKSMVVACAKHLIMLEFNNECLTLFTYLARHDKKYQNYRTCWGHDSKACFKLRVKWFEALILKLESKGL